MPATVDEAFAHCEARVKAHYENFPVGLFVPREKRRYVHALYAFAQIADDRLILTGLVGSVDGKTVIRTRVEGAPDEPAALGRQAADELIDLGARDILREVFTE